MIRGITSCSDTGTTIRKKKGICTVRESRVLKLRVLGRRNSRERGEETCGPSSEIKVESIVEVISSNGIGPLDFRKRVIET